jgi:hypothetical protein
MSEIEKIKKCPSFFLRKKKKGKELGVSQDLIKFAKNVIISPNRHPRSPESRLEKEVCLST